ncbi:putative leader peptide [Streptomyces sp. NBC_01089]
MRAGQAVATLPALPGLTHRRHIDLARVNSACCR